MGVHTPNSTKNIFVLNGSPRAGKNTFVDSFPCKVTHYSYVDLTKRMLDHVGVDYHFKNDSARVLLESINNALEKYDDIPFKDICSVADDFLNGYFETVYLFIDVRKPENIKRFLDKYKGSRSVFIHDGKTVSHATESDSQVSNYSYDFYVDNTGTMENLKEEVQRFLKGIE